MRGERQGHGGEGHRTIADGSSDTYVAKVLRGRGLRVGARIQKVEFSWPTQLLPVKAGAAGEELEDLD